MGSKLAMLLIVLAGPAFGADSDAELREVRAELNIEKKYSDRKDVEIAALKKRVAELEKQLKGSVPGPAATKAEPAASMPAASPAASPVAKPAPLQPGQKCAVCLGVGKVSCQMCWNANKMSTGQAKCFTCGYRGRIVCPDCHGDWGGMCKVCNGTGVRYADTAGRGGGYACRECDGSGTRYRCRRCAKGTLPCPECKGQADRDPCPVCNGEKKVPCAKCPAKPAAPAATRPAGE